MIRAELKVSLNELCEIERIENELVVEIVEYGIVKPIAGNESSDWMFETSSVHWIKKAVRIHQDLEIDWVAVALVIDLMRQRELLQRENDNIRQQLKRFVE